MRTLILLALLSLSIPAQAQVIASPPAAPVVVKPAPPSAQPPSVTITATCRTTQPGDLPPDCYAPAILDLTATVVSLPAGYVVQFVDGVTVLATLLGPPYVFAWSNVPAGEYKTLRALLRPQSVVAVPPAPVPVDGLALECYAPQPGWTLSPPCPLCPVPAQGRPGGPCLFTKDGV